MSTINVKEITGGFTAVPGFLASGIHAGLKKEKPDLALLYNPRLCSAAGVFTTNAVKAAPLLLSMERLKEGCAHGVVINAGNANACNGSRGMDDAKAMALAAAKELGVDEKYMLVSSTGVIGVPMPMDKILPGIARAARELSAAGGRKAAQAIMTTDLITKEHAVKLEIAGETVTIGGMAKGSGMIHPRMATMLAFIATDAAVDAGTLKAALKQVVDDTFNMITVDGDTSTNDSVVILASGEARNRPIKEGTPEYNIFLAGLTAVCTKLAQDIAMDGEGATTLLEVVVKNAPTLADARLAARAVAGSNLFKCAVFGQDANWGRILCAVGYSGARFDPQRVDIYIGDEQVAKDGGGLAFNEERAAEILSSDRVTVTVDLKEGEYSATAWGCDLTYEYVRINGSYRT
ncbi:glutamate N-acetyltransferase/amino-acid N-acetyltransferase [Desulfohalotomaculum tongense]|uniref:bifunctional glutamate N-acetyltransferase/amino-acid acetyltransferase ArgJ n=1 Tax=Desulforadius tongensis TaxID=1216062 RepID=UPI00195825FB|nr:bifunctional glutamate N-acetyltransferase/amino-acid acetyltransferase ArgJ [Desulforadius tongensis]MBM7853871.1 glutamate N-acetyltransferase/amino-acid N-acetyltransferase [Desulforadius tongensis]